MTHRILGRVVIAFLMLSTALWARAQEPVERVRWRFEIPSNFSGKFIGVGADGRIYTTRFDPGTLYALTPDGSLVWSLDLGAPSAHWPISFANDGTIYTGAVGVRAVNPDGTLRWTFDPGSWIDAGPSVGPDGNIYGAADGAVGGLGFFSLDANGSLRWANLGDPIATGLTEGLDEIVFGADRLFGGIHFRRSGPWLTSYAFDLNGSQLWFGGVAPRYFDLNSAPQMLPDGRLAYRAGQGSLAAVSQDGFADWVLPHPDGAQMLVQPAVGPDGSIYAGDVYGVQLWSATPDGTTRWVRGSVSEDFLSSVGLGVSPDNRVLIAGGWSNLGGVNQGWIRGYSTANGELLWQIDLPDEQGEMQLTRSVRPAFSANSDTAYVTTYFTSNGVGHSYLYAINLDAGPQVDPRLALSLSGSAVTGGSSLTGTVTLGAPAPAGGASVTLTTNYAGVTIPASVVIPAGETQAGFPVSTTPVASTITGVSITAFWQFTTTTASFTILPPGLSALSLDPARVRGGTPSLGTVVLTGPAAVDTVVALTSSSPYAGVPPSVVVPAGSSQASFQVTTVPVRKNTNATITAAIAGQSLSTKLTITRR